MGLLDKIMVVEGEQVELSPEIKQRMKDSFDTAVEREMDEYFLDGVSVVMTTLDKMGMRESRILVENRLVKDGIITVDEVEEQEQKTNESKCYADILAGMIG